MDLTREERKIEGEREGREGEMRNRKREGYIYIYKERYMKVK